MNQSYTKIAPFIYDVKVSKIQSLADKPVIVTRSGRKIATRVVLTSEEISELFLYFAGLANIPIVDEKIRLVLDNLTIEGLNTRDNRASFLISKNTAYSLLEKN